MMNKEKYYALLDLFAKYNNGDIKKPESEDDYSDYEPPEYADPEPEEDNDEEVKKEERLNKLKSLFKE